MDIFVDPHQIRRRSFRAPMDSDSDSSSASNSKGSDSPQKCALSVCSTSIDPNAKMTDSIYMFLLKIFENEEIKDHDCAFLSPTAISYLESVLHRKFIFGPNFSSLELIKARRRNEEQFKFVVKKGIKRLFKNFKKVHKGFIKGDKLLDELEFYKHYFWETAGFDRANFDGFFLPGSKIQKEFSAPMTKLDRTVSFNYLSRIFRSELFKKDFISYLLNGFAEEYVQTRAQRLLKVAVNFEAGRRPKGSKLPWTRWEMTEAQKSFVNLICSFGS